MVTDEIETIDQYEEAKTSISGVNIEHKDELVNTIDHIQDEEREHVDELIDAASKIPFAPEAGTENTETTEAPVEESPAEEIPETEPAEEPIADESLKEEVSVDFDKVAQDLENLIIKDDEELEPLHEDFEEKEIDEKAIEEAINAKLRETGNEDAVFESFDGSFDDNSILVEGVIVSGDMKVPTKFRFESLGENKYKVTNTLSDEVYDINL